jgi:DNA-binding transcriptional MerR regulator
LVPKIAVAENGYRSFVNADVQRLRFVRRLRSLGMSLPEVRQFLQLDVHSESDCATAQAAVGEHLKHVTARISELKALQTQLKALSARCDGRSSPCKILELLGDARDDTLAGPSREPVCHPSAH